MLLLSSFVCSTGNSAKTLCIPGKCAAAELPPPPPQTPSFTKKQAAFRLVLLGVYRFENKAKEGCLDQSEAPSQVSAIE